MPVAGFNNLGVVELLRAEIKIALTGVSETPSAIPYCTSADQVVVDPALLPLTVIEMGRSLSDTTGYWYEHRIPAKIHHIRRTESGTGIAAETIMSRIETIAQQLQADYRMKQPVVNGAPNVENTLIHGYESGDDNELQNLLTRNEQNIGLVVGTLHIEIHLWETTG